MNILLVNFIKNNYFFFKTKYFLAKYFFSELCTFCVTILCSWVSQKRKLLLNWLSISIKQKNPCYSVKYCNYMSFKKNKVIKVSLTTTVLNPNSFHEKKNYLNLRFSHLKITVYSNSVLEIDMYLLLNLRGKCLSQSGISWLFRRWSPLLVGIQIRVPSKSKQMNISTSTMNPLFPSILSIL